MTIKKAPPSDANTITKIHIASWQGAYRGIIPDNILDNISFHIRETMWREGLEQGWNCFLFEEMGEVLGFVSYCPSRDADADPHFTAEIAAIHIHPDHWRKGFGRLLYEKILAEAKQAQFKELTLWCLEENYRARKFYENLGFVLTPAIKYEDMDGITLPEVRYRMAL